MRDLHLVSAFNGTTWAIREEKLLAIRAVLERHISGRRLTPEEIELAIAGAPRPSAKAPGGIGVLPIRGVLLHRAMPLEESSGLASTDRLHQMFRAMVADPQLKAIVLDVDSPGGEVHGIDEFAATIRAAREEKHIVAVANAEAASAAYYLAAQAGELVVTPSGSVGSIGVLWQHIDVTKALEMEGVTQTLISAGKYKAEFWGPLTDEAKAHAQERVDAYYEAFTGAVAQGRGVPKSRVKANFGEGRMVLAADAVRVGMADRVATLDQVLEKLGVSRVPGPTARPGARAEQQELPIAAAAADEPSPAEPAAAEAPPAETLSPVEFEFRRKRLALTQRS